MTGTVRTVITSARVSVPAGFVACSVTFTTPSADGVPVRAPVCASKLSHCGALTLTTGAVPEAVTP